MEPPAEPAPYAPILLVEDDPDVRESLAEVMTLLGYRVVSAENGELALQWLESGALPGLLLLDLMMPVMDGWQLLAVLQARPAWATVPVIVLSAAVDGRTLPSNVAACFRKPAEISDLMEEVARCYREPKRNSEATADPLREQAEAHREEAEAIRRMAEEQLEIAAQVWSEAEEHPATRAVQREIVAAQREMAQEMLQMADEMREEADALARLVEQKR